MQKVNMHQPSAPDARGLDPPPYGGHVQIATQTTFGPYPMRMICHFCSADVVTQTSYKPGSLTYIIGVVLCVFTCCCCIPFCIDGCKDVVHSCPLCHRKLGVSKRM